jgi:uncharacterized YigZ family protein
MFITPEMKGTASEIIIKKSRFIGRVFPVQSAEEVETELLQVRQMEKSASHNCFAYSVGLGVPVERFSDDGEPSGTAGRPILEVIRRRGISNVLVVVTRYFGGTLLGANGLIRAYADSASHALDKTAMLMCRQMNRIELVCDYGQYGKLEYELGRQGFTLMDKQFSNEVAFFVLVPVEEADTLCKQIADWSGGQASVVVKPAEFIGLSADGSFHFDVVHS